MEVGIAEGRYEDGVDKDKRIVEGTGVEGMTDIGGTEGTEAATGVVEAVAAAGTTAGRSA